MKHTKLTVGCIGSLMVMALTACVATPDTYYGAGLGEEGYYGTVPLLPGYTPQLWNTSPITAIGVPTGAAIYLNVPAYQRLNWGVYCSIYNACYRPVYFVLNSWYASIFAPAYIRRYGRPGPAFRPLAPPKRPAPGKPGPNAKPPTVRPGSIPGLKPGNQRPAGAAAVTTGIRPGKPGGSGARPAGRPGGAGQSGVATASARPGATGAKPPAGARPAPPPRGGASGSAFIAPARGGVGARGR